MIKLPLIKVALGGPMMSPMMQMPPLPQMAPPPVSPTMPMPGIAGNGGGSGMQSPSVKARSPAPGATSAFKLSRLKLAFGPGTYPPVQQHPSRAGFGNAVLDTGRDFAEGLGNYSLDVLQENEKKTQRPNDPRVMDRTGIATV